VVETSPALRQHFDLYFTDLDQCHRLAMNVSPLVGLDSENTVTPVRSTTVRVAWPICSGFIPDFLVFDWRIVSVDRRWRKGLSNCIGHGGKARAPARLTGVELSRLVQSFNRFPLVFPEGKA
jgi:hypothetical protein